MKKYYKLTINLVNKDETQIPEYVRVGLDDPAAYWDFCGFVYQDGEEMPGVIEDVCGVESEEMLQGIIAGLLAPYKKELFNIDVQKEECIIEDLIAEKENKLKAMVVSKYMRNHRGFYGELPVREYNELLRHPPKDLYYEALVENTNDIL
ncbi:MAG: hypothetical protein K5923_03240 [Clostridia bacterium]|nr:hypothetical protein [Clostridia bacterium]